MTSNIRSNRADQRGMTAAWAALRVGTPEALLEVATDPSSGAEALATITPPHDQLDTLPTAVALAILSHPRCPGGLADRLSRHPDPVVRLAVIHQGGCGAMGQPCLLADPDPRVRAAAEAAWPG